jgi:trans-aconitate methyltransferase
MNIVIQNFDRSVAGYAAHAITQNALAAKLADWIALEERSGYAIELGAGTGLFTQKLQPWAGPYLATDAAPHMVAAGVENCPLVAWKQQEAEQPQYLGPADWVFACNLLQWLGNPAAALKAWHDTLKPEGHLVIAVLLPGTFQELHQVLPEANPLIWRSAEDWAKIVEDAGFVLEREESWKHIHIYPNALDFLRAIHAMGLAPRTVVGPGRLRTALREYDRQFAAPSGVRSTWQAWLARAVAV